MSKRKDWDIRCNVCKEPIPHSDTMRVRTGYWNELPYCETCWDEAPDKEKGMNLKLPAWTGPKPPKGWKRSKAAM